MNRPKFTPGPLRVLHEGSSEVSVQTDGACICSLNYDPLPKEEVQKHLANAHLIAAAPEMFNLLEKFVEITETNDVVPIEFFEHASRVKKILREARGEA